MNMISTGAFLTEMDASQKQETLVSKLVSAWEKKNAKVARAGGLSLMALSLAACGSDDDTSSTSTSTTTTTTTTTAGGERSASDVRAVHDHRNEQDKHDNENHLHDNDVAAFPTEARMRQKQKEQMAKILGQDLKLLKARHKFLQEQHYDDCGSSTEGINENEPTHTLNDALAYCWIND